MGKVFSSEEKIKEYIDAPEVNRVITLATGEKVSYSEIGSQHKKTLIVFPGISGNRICIESTAFYLRENDFRVILLDWPGYGESTIIKKRSLATYCDYFENVLKALIPDETQKFAVFGTSAGCVHISKIITDTRFKKRVICAILASPWTSPRAKGSNFSTKLVSKLPICLTRRIAQHLQSSSSSELTKKSFAAGMKKELSENEINYLTNVWELDEEAWTIFMKRFFEISKVAGYLETFYVCVEQYHKLEFDLNQVDPDINIFVFYGDKDETAPAKAVESFYLNPILKTVLEKNFTFVKVKDGSHDGVPFTQMATAMQHVINAFN